MFGALPSRIARCSTGYASPSISRKTIPGSRLSTRSPERRAIRLMTRSEYVSSSSAPSSTSSTTATAEVTSAMSSAAPKLLTWIAELSRFDATWKTSASTTRMSRKSTTSVSGSRIAAMIGGTTKFTAPTNSATTSAPQKLGIETPGRIAAAISSAGVITSSVPRRRIEAELRLLGLPDRLLPVLGGRGVHRVQPRQPTVETHRPLRVMRWEAAQRGIGRTTRGER